jgi:hypothetical protein
MRPFIWQVNMQSPTCWCCYDINFHQILSVFPFCGGRSKKPFRALLALAFQIESTTSLEISGIINKLNSDSASGCDRISTRFCKRAVLFFWLMLFPDWLTTVFPSCLKLARVVPVLKSGSQLVLNNYHPISILNIFSKIFEHFLHIRLQKYLDAHSVINGNQYGFVHLSNTLLATMSLLSFVREKLDAGLLLI